MRWVSLRLEALADIEEVQDYFAAGGPSFKDRFTRELEETIELIQQFPEAFPKVLGGATRRFGRSEYRSPPSLNSRGFSWPFLL